MIEPSQEVLSGWGMANHATSLVYRPRTIEEVRWATEDARARGLIIAHRGAGQSYGDAALNQNGALLDMTGLAEIESFDRDRGIVRAQSGVTMGQLWKAVLPERWWPPVVPGTALPTLGGCLAMNIHGKNHLKVGSFGEHVRGVTVLTANGEIRTFEADDAGFPAFVGTQGLRGTILAMKLKLSPLSSGFLEVERRFAGHLSDLMSTLRHLAEEHDHAVAWVDCFAGGRSEGRGELHGASYLAEGHALTGKGLTIPEQTQGRWDLTRHLFQTLAPWALRASLNDFGIRSLNAGKSARARLRGTARYHQALARFHFPVDTVPDWKHTYGEGGLVQYQFFVPQNVAEDVFREALQRQRSTGIRSYLAVMKAHRDDAFPSAYCVAGYSLALDFSNRARSRPALLRLLAEFDQLQKGCGGRVYAAKDTVSRLGRLPVGRDALYGTNLSRRWERAASSANPDPR